MSKNPHLKKETSADIPIFSNLSDEFKSELEELKKTIISAGSKDRSVQINDIIKDQPEYLMSDLTVYPDHTFDIVKLMRQIPTLRSKAENADDKKMVNYLDKTLNIFGKMHNLIMYNPDDLPEGKNSNEKGYSGFNYKVNKIGYDLLTLLVAEPEMIRTNLEGKFSNSVDDLFKTIFSETNYVNNGYLKDIVGELGSILPTYAKTILDSKYQQYAKLGAVLKDAQDFANSDYLSGMSGFKKAFDKLSPEAQIKAMEILSDDKHRIAMRNPNNVNRMKKLANELGIENPRKSKIVSNLEIPEVVKALSIPDPFGDATKILEEAYGYLFGKEELNEAQQNKLKSIMTEFHKIIKYIDDNKIIEDPRLKGLNPVAVQYITQSKMDVAHGILKHVDGFFENNETNTSYIKSELKNALMELTKRPDEYDPANKKTSHVAKQLDDKKNKLS